MFLYKKWITVSLSSFMVVIFIMTIFNYTIDSLGIFRKISYLAAASKDLTNAKMIARFNPNYNERLFQEYIIQDLNVQNDVIVLGSSRTMQLRKHFFVKPTTNFFNHSVSGAELGDYISIIGAYSKIQNYIPKKIIIGIDPWIFNENTKSELWQKHSYDYLRKKINPNYEVLKKDSKKIQKWKQLFNFEYTLSNIGFFKKILKGTMYHITKTSNINAYIKDIDGSIYYPYSKRYPNYSKVKQDAMKYARGNVYKLNNFDNLARIELFEDFIKYLKIQNIDIIFYLAPYNPIAYDIMIKRKEYKNILVAEKYLTDYAKKYNIKLFGSYNPHIFNLDNKGFFDGMHSHADTVAKTLEKTTNSYRKKRK